uniref:Uncharacterized protein n=1 Tax=Rhizophora mucronata TaxID=61149 RepID=A0A2P2ITU3_RHIMU
MPPQSTKANLTGREKSFWHHSSQILCGIWTMACLKLHFFPSFSKHRSCLPFGHFWISASLYPLIFLSKHLARRHHFQQPSPRPSI